MNSITVKVLTLLCISFLFVTCGKNEIGKQEKNIAEEPIEQESKRSINEQNTVREEVKGFKKIEPTIPGDINTKRGIYIGKQITGSWTAGDPKRIVEREVSWGRTEINKHEFFIFDFLVSKPLIIWGASEGGPPFDQVVGRIVGMDIEDNSIWLYYRNISSWSILKTNPETGKNWFTAYEPSDEETLGSDINRLHIWYNEETDTISVDPETMIAGCRYSKDDKVFRVSERIQ